MPEGRELSFTEIQALSQLIADAFQDYSKIEGIHKSEINRRKQEIDSEGYGTNLPVKIVQQALLPIEEYVEAFLNKLNEEKIAVKFALRPLYRRSKSDLTPDFPEENEKFQRYVEKNFKGFEPSLLTNIVELLIGIIEKLIERLNSLLSDETEVNFDNFGSFYSNFKLVATLKGYHDIYHHISESDQEIFYEPMPAKNKVRRIRTIIEVYQSLKDDVKILEPEYVSLSNNPDFQRLHSEYFRTLETEITFIVDALSKPHLDILNQPQIINFLNTIPQAMRAINEAMKNCRDDIESFNFRNAFGEINDLTLAPILGACGDLVVDELIVKQIKLHATWQSALEFLNYCVDDLEQANSEERSLATGERKWIRKTQNNWREVDLLFHEIQTIQGDQVNPILADAHEQAKSYFQKKDFHNFQSYLYFLKDNVSPCFLTLDNSLKKNYNEIAGHLSKISALEG